VYILILYYYTVAAVAYTVDSLLKRRGVKDARVPCGSNVELMMDGRQTGVKGVRPYDVNERLSDRVHILYLLYLINY